jgi:hypothetical protein
MKAVELRDRLAKVTARWPCGPPEPEARSRRPRGFKITLVVCRP